MRELQRAVRCRYGVREHWHRKGSCERCDADTGYVNTGIARARVSGAMPIRGTWTLASQGLVWAVRCQYGVREHWHRKGSCERCDADTGYMNTGIARARVSGAMPIRGTWTLASQGLVWAVRCRYGVREHWHRKGSCVNPLSAIHDYFNLY